MSKVRFELNADGIEQLKKEVAASIQEKGIEVKCIYCGGQFSAHANLVTCPHCNKEFEIEFRM